MEDVEVQRLADGDRDAWNRVYAPLFGEILKVLKSRVRSGLGVDWEGAAADIIVKDLMPGLRDRTGKFADLRTVEDLHRFARVVAARRAIDLIRRISRRGEGELPEDFEQRMGGTDPNWPGLDEEFEALIGELDPPKPELFRDYFQTGLTYQEISDAREMALGTVCSHFYRGLKQLRSILESRGRAPQPSASRGSA